MASRRKRQPMPTWPSRCVNSPASARRPAMRSRSIIEFREHVPVLLCTESGGEGRNIQFCNTLINFDVPWNPMAIEQRIGRIDRIGQSREVFIFNLVTRVRSFALGFSGKQQLAV